MPSSSLTLVALPFTASLGAVALAPLGPAAQAAGLCVMGTTLLLALRSHLQERRALVAASEAAIKQVVGRERSLLEAQRELETALTLLRDQLRDPVRDARVARIAALQPRVRLRVGERQLEAALIDLTMFELVVKGTPADCAAWIPGLPVRVSLSIEGASPSPVGWASVYGERRPDGSHVLRWAPPVDETAIPRALWRAGNPRDAHRVDVRGGVQATLHAPSGPRQARLNNLSATGAAIQVGLSRREAGELRREVLLDLELPSGESLRVNCTVRHLSVSDRHATLGLHFDPSADRFAEIQPRLAALVLRQSTLSVPVRSAS